MIALIGLGHPKSLGPSARPFFRAAGLNLCIHLLEQPCRLLRELAQVAIYYNVQKLGKLARKLYVLA